MTTPANSGNLASKPSEFRWWKVLVVCGSLALLAGIAIGLSESFQDCEHAQKNHRIYRELHEESSITVKAIVRLRLHTACGVHSTHENEGPLTLLATIMLVGFTATLWRATDKLWRSAENELVAFRQSLDQQRKIADDQIAKMEANNVEAANTAKAALASAQLAQQEFASTHRPRLFIRSVQPRALNADQRVVIRYTIFNRGEIAATMMAWRMGVVVLDKGKHAYGMEGVDAVEYPLGSDILGGMDHTADFESPKNLNAHDHDRIIRGMSNLYFCGTITYYDSGGNLRRCGFVRQYEAQILQFGPTGDHDNDYEY